MFSREEQRALLFLLFSLILGVSILFFKEKRYKEPITVKTDTLANQSLIIKPIEKRGVFSKNKVVTSKKESFKQKPLVVNINKASLSQLMKLPRIGPVLAKRIIEYREKNKAFSSPEEIVKVCGIGKKTYQRIKDFITIEDGP